VFACQETRYLIFSTCERERVMCVRIQYLVRVCVSMSYVLVFSIWFVRVCLSSVFFFKIEYVCVLACHVC